MGINLAGSIVILDEAHNVESTLCEAGSGRFTFTELCELCSFLHVCSSSQEHKSSFYQMISFVERAIKSLKESRDKFEIDDQGETHELSSKFSNHRSNGI